MATNPALWTSTAQTEMYRFFAVAFNAAPGTTYMDQLYDAVTSGMSTEQIVEVFTSKSQFTNVYPRFMSNKDFATKLVNNVVGSSATDAAKATAVADIEAALASGYSRGKVVYQIFTNLANKTADDATWAGTAKQMANQVAVSKYYTETLLQGGENLATLQKVIAGVTKDTAVGTTAALQSIIDTAVPTPGQTFTLTTGLDNITGGTGPDTINGVATTYQDSDIIDGGAGTDTLYVSVAAGITPTRLTNVEVISVNSTGVGTVNLNAVSGLQTLGLLNSGGAMTVSNHAATTGLAITNDGGFGTTVTTKGTGLTGSSDVLSLALNGATGAIAVASASPSVDDYETVSITTSGNSSTLPSLNVGDSGAANTFSTLNITGSAALTVTAALGTSVKTVDASTASGAVSVTVGITTGATLKGGSGNDSLTGGTGNDVITGGEGADTLAMGGTGNDSLDGGAGNDSINATGADGNDTIMRGDGSDTLTLTAGLTYTKATSTSPVVNAAANVTGFETLSLSGTQDMTGLAVGNTFSTLSVPTLSTATVTEAPATLNKFSFSGATGAASVTLATAADTSADAAAVTLGSASGQSASVVSSLTLGGYDTLSIATTGANGNGITSLVGTKLSSIAVTGSKTLTALGLASTTVGVKSIDASGYTGSTLSGITGSSGTTAVGFNFVPGTGSTTYGVTGGAGADTLTGGTGNDTLNGSDGNDILVGGGGNLDDLTGGAGADTLTGGTGNDTLLDGSGNDIVSGLAGNDTITLGSGADSIDAGAGNDTITGSTNVDSTDTIAGGDGTDSLTAIFSSVGQTPTVTGVESVAVSFGASTFLSMSKVDATTTAITVDSASAAAVSPTVKDIATGVTVTLSDDLVTGTATDLGAVTLDTAASATLKVALAGNTNASTTVASTLAGLTITDAATVSITSSGGSTSNVIDNSIGGNLTLDATDTTGTLSITTGSGSGFTLGSGNDIASTTKLTGLSLTAATYGDITIDDMADATALQTISYTASGTSAAISIDALGGAVGAATNSAALTSVTVSASGGATIGYGAISASASNLDSVSITGTGTGTIVTPAGALTTGNGAVNSLTMTASDRATVTMAAGDLTVGTGLLSAVTASATGRGSLNLVGFVSNSQATGVAGAWSFSTSDRGTMTFDATSSITTDGNITSLGVTVGSDSTLTSDGGTISSAATITSATVTVASDATTSGTGLTLGESTSTHTATSVILAEAAANGLDLNLAGTTFTALTVTLDGSANITAGTVDLDANGTARVANSLRFGFDSNNEAITVLKAAVTGADSTTIAPTITRLNLDVSTSTGTNTLDVSLASAAYVLGGTGNDTITGTGGADTVSGGSGNDAFTLGGGADSVNGGTGNDSITGGAGADTLTGSSGADRFTFAASESNVTSSTSTDGVDRITDFTGGTDILQLPVATAGTLNTGSGSADLSVNAANVASTGTTITTLLANLQTAATAQQTASAGLWAQAGDTMLVKITGASLAGTDVIYVVQNAGTDSNVTDADLIIALVGTSTQAATVATVIGP